MHGWFNIVQLFPKNKQKHSNVITQIFQFFFPSASLIITQSGEKETPKFFPFCCVCVKNGATNIFII
jgi:hypothetical protein